MTRIFLSPRPLTVFAQALFESVPPIRLSAYHWARDGAQE
jgi:hypothetical protein